jgi:hypothetical protein
MEYNLKFMENGRQPQSLVNGSWPKYFDKVSMNVYLATKYSTNRKWALPLIPAFTLTQWDNWLTE